jgi:RNA polymerase sigma-70 factor (ECF subfamily)
LKIRNLYPNESELIRNASRHNRRAQEALYQKFAPKMLSVCRYYIRDMQHVEDVLMEGFLSIFFLGKQHLKVNTKHPDKNQY